MRTFLQMSRIIIVATFMAAGVVSCNNKDDYDWNSVEAGRQRISRTDGDTSKIKLDSMKGDNYTVKKYVAIARGGSEYKWVSSNGFLIVNVDAEQPYKVSIKADSRVDTSAWLWVQETSRSGKKSEPDSMKINITSFCNFNIDDFLGSGNFSSKMSYYAPYDVHLSKSDGDTLINDNFFNMKWKVKYIFSKDYDEIITIVPKQKFLYNEEVVEVNGKGTYNTCKGRIEIKFAVTKVNSGDTLKFGSGTDVLLRK